jgi:hypothetical protein
MSFFENKVTTDLKTKLLSVPSKPKKCRYTCVLLSILLLAPTFLFLFNLFDLNLSQNLAYKIFLLLISMAVAYLVSFFFKRMSLLLILIFVAYLSIGEFTESYGFKNLLFDIKTMFNHFNSKAERVKINLQSEPGQGGIIWQDTSQGPVKFFDAARKIQAERSLRVFKRQILEQCDYTDEIVRGFATHAIRNNFANEQKQFWKYRQLIQFFAIFKEIKTQWIYVNDPRGFEIFAKASVSADLLSGDCDDYSILMVSSLKVIGARARMIYTKNHIYPEVFIGKVRKLETVRTLIAAYLFPKEYNNESIHYHIDDNGDVWINMDYTRPFPGGEFLSNEIVQIIELP